MSEGETASQDETASLLDVRYEIAALLDLVFIASLFVLMRFYSCGRSMLRPYSYGGCNQLIHECL